MLKRTITYVDYDGEKQSVLLHFNLTKTELMENLDLKKKLEDVRDRLEGPERDLTVEEIRMLLDVVKYLMKVSYGVRSEDGKRFIKNEEVWTEFTQTPAYDEAIFSLFKNPEEAVAFITGIAPADLREEVNAEMAKTDAPARQKVPLDHLQKGIPTTSS